MTFKQGVPAIPPLRDWGGMETSLFKVPDHECGFDFEETSLFYRVELFPIQEGPGLMAAAEDEDSHLSQASTFAVADPDDDGKTSD
eukprot:1791398-Rhodomonas_salina.1